MVNRNGTFRFGIFQEIVYHWIQLETREFEFANGKEELIIVSNGTSEI